MLALLWAMQEEVLVDQLSEILEVTPLTIWRDLEELAEEKAIITTHGGCLLVGHAALESENYNGFIFQLQIFNGFKHPANIGIHNFNHTAHGGTSLKML